MTFKAKHEQSRPNLLSSRTTHAAYIAFYLSKPWLEHRADAAATAAAAAAAAKP